VLKNSVGKVAKNCRFSACSASSAVKYSEVE